MNSDVLISIATVIGLPGLVVYCTTIFFSDVIKNFSSRIFPTLNRRQAFIVILSAIGALTFIFCVALIVFIIKPSQLIATDSFKVFFSQAADFRAKNFVREDGRYLIAFGYNPNQMLSPTFQRKTYRRISFSICQDSGLKQIVVGEDDSEGSNVLIDEKSIENRLMDKYNLVYFHLEKNFYISRQYLIMDLMHLDCIDQIEDEMFVLFQSEFTNNVGIRQRRLDFIIILQSYAFDSNNKCISYEISYKIGKEDLGEKSFADYIEQIFQPLSPNRILDTPAFVEFARQRIKEKGRSVADLISYAQREKEGRDIRCKNNSIFNRFKRVVFSS